MSTHPEEDEIEEGEIVSEDEISLDMSDDEQILEDDGIDIAELLSSLMATR